MDLTALSQEPEKLVEPAPTPSTDAFWSGFGLPRNREDDTLEFVNPVVAAEWFADQTVAIGRVSSQAEALDEDIANLRIHHRRAEEDLRKCKRRILAANFEKLAKSADKAMQDAFVYHIASWEQTTELQKLEGAVEDLQQEIETRVPRRDQLVNRLHRMKDAQESARQYLDYNKLEMRIEAGKMGGHAR